MRNAVEFRSHHIHTDGVVQETLGHREAANESDDRHLKSLSTASSIAQVNIRLFLRHYVDRMASNCDLSRHCAAACQRVDSPLGKEREKLETNRKLLNNFLIFTFRLQVECSNEPIDELGTFSSCLNSWVILYIDL